MMPVERASSVHTTVQTSINAIGFTKNHHVLNGAGANVDTVTTCKSNKPFILYVTAVTDSIDGNVKVTFKDGDAITYTIPAGTSFSFTHAAGGIQSVDGELKIEPSDNVDAWISILTTSDATASFGTFLGTPRFCTNDGAVVNT